MEASEDGIGKGGPEQWQNDLEKRFGTTIDSSLITALVHEPGQTYNEVYATLLSLAGDEQDRSSNTAIEKDGGLDSNAASSATLVDTHEIERTLEEWKLADDEANNAENLRLTDDEETPSAIKGAEREATALGDATGKGELPVHELAGGQVDIAARHEAGEVASGFAFLTHAFPTRTPAFLHSILDDEKGDVQKAVETLMTLELVENGGLDHESSDAAQAGRTSSRLTDDDDGLFNGRQTKKLTKRDRQRRKYEQAQSQGLHASKTSVAQRVNLTDVRQGALPTRRIAKMRPEHETRSIWSADATENEDDEALAARLAREERIAAGLPPDAKDEEDDVVADNDWLFSSSVLEQLSVLMGIADHVVKATHAACHMNLRATLHRLIFMQTQAFPTLTSLDAHTDSDEGTSEAVVVNLNHLLPAKSRKEIEQFYRATGGQEDAVLDLVQLADRIEASAAGDRTDVLDPMKTDRKTAEVYAPASTLQASHDAGHFAFVDGNNGLAASATPYASAAGRTNASKSMAPARQYALQRLQQGAASVTFPLNSAAHASSSSSAATDDGASVETAAQAARLAHEYTLIAHEYRQRRQEYLSKAATSYRSTHNAAISRGPMRGAAAWVYAEEARRLDAKARAFALQAAQATVRYRTLINRSSSSSAVHSGNSRGADMAGEQGDVIDLHGVTVHQALSITRQSLNTWWSKNQYKTSVAPLHLITGVGRHSKGQIALIRPAVLAMLQRERWNCREQQTGHIVVLGRH